MAVSCDTMYNTFRMCTAYICCAVDGKCVSLSNRENNIKQKEYIVCLLILTVLLAALWLPVLSEPVLLILLPVCLSYVFVRFDFRRAVFSAAVVLLLPMLFTMQFDISVFSICVPFAAVLAFALRKNYGLLGAVSFGAAGVFISYALLGTLGIAAMGGLSAFRAQTGQLWSEMEAQLEQMMTAYGLSSQAGAAYRQTLAAILPAAAVCAAASLAYIVLYLCTRMLRRRDLAYASVYRPFCEIKADKSCAAAVAVLFMASMFTGGIFGAAMIGCVLVLMFFMFVCGFSAVCFFVKRISNRLLRTAVFVLLFAVSFMTFYVFLFIGFADAFLNIRNIGSR